jgi:SPP1 family predicted phage head-tail adaptor
MNAKHRITIRSATETVGDMGGFKTEYSDLASMYAIIEPMKQIERTQYSKLDSEVSHKITVRYQSMKYRIVFKGRQFEVTQAIDLFEDNRYVRIIASEVLS